MNFHFWQPAPNEHESGWIRGLANKGFAVQVYICGDMPESRHSLGLGKVDYGAAEIVRLPLALLKTHLVSCSKSEDLHFFTGIKEFQLNRLAYRLLSPTPARLFYISESKDPRGFIGTMRFLRDIVYDYDRRRRIDAVLAMGSLGTGWFRKIGFDSTRIFEYCYALTDDVDHKGNIDPKHADVSSTSFLKIVYAGQLIRRKRVDTLLSALSIIGREGLPFTLEVIGTGDAEEHLRQLAERLGITSSVQFHGAMNNSLLRAYMRESDLLVLPSAWDGWGAVTNEALLAGCRVGVSLMSGSSALCKSNPNCFAFPSGDVSTIANELRKQIAAGKVTHAERAKRRLLAHSMIGETAITNYLLRIVDFVKTPADKKPLPPWEPKMSVALIYHFFPHYRRALLEQLIVSASCDFVMAADNDAGAVDPSIENWNAPLNYPIIHLPIFRLPFGLYWQRNLLGFACKSALQGAVLLGDPNNLTTWIAALIFRARQVRVLYWAHGWIDGKESWLKCHLRKIFFSLPHGLLLYGRRAKRLAVQLDFDPDSIWVVYNSLDYSLQKSIRRKINDRNRLEMRRQLFGTASVPVVVCISRLTPVRGLDLLINAVAELKVKGFDCCLLLIGDGTERTKLEKQASDLSIRFHCTGALYDEEVIGPLLSCATVTVAPGKVGLTAMHSLAYGVPVLTHGNRDKQMPECEAIIPGLTGDFFQLGNVADIAETIRRWTRFVDVPESIRKHCYAVIERFYNADTQAKIIEEAIFGYKPRVTIGDAIQPQEITA